MADPMEIARVRLSAETSENIEYLRDDLLLLLEILDQEMEASRQRQSNLVEVMTFWMNLAVEAQNHRRHMPHLQADTSHPQA